MKKKELVAASTGYAWPAQVTSNNNANIVQVWITHNYNGIQNMWYISGANCLPTPAPSPSGWTIPAESGKPDEWTITWVDNQNNIFSTGYGGGPNGPNTNDNLVITLYQEPGYNNSYVQFSWNGQGARTQDADQYGNGYSI